MASISVYAALFFFAAGMTCLTSPRQVMPHGRKVIMTMCITDTPYTAARWTKAAARIAEYRTTDSAEWHVSNEKVVVRLDSSICISVGDRLIATGYAGSLGSDDYAGYVRMMQRRGYTSNVWINTSEDAIILPRKSRTPAVVAARIREAAIDRLSRLDLNPQGFATAAAMSLGWREGMGRDLKESYSMTGASHLLAVSGLHVGIVALFINILLYLLPSFRYGHIVKNIAAVATIWAYAFLTGLSPSVIRAAMMFTGAQAALAASRTGNSANILLATASVMLLVNPYYLYDVSFQLSFAAVAGIFMLYRPLYRAVSSRFKLLNAFWAVFIVGLAATLATAPLVSHYFGRIPVIGLILNPIFILTANMTVLFSLLWIVCPLGLLKGTFSFIIGLSTGLQNSLAEACAAKSWAAIPVKMEMWQVVALYAATLAIYLTLKRRNLRKRTVLISDTI